MRHLARLLILWLIAVALPVQGVAAATMLHCKAAESPAHEGHGHHHGAMGASHAAHSHQHDNGKSTCSVCAACCCAAALPALPIVLAAPEQAASPLAVPHLPAAAFLTSGPERPPRTARS
ncbi:hypothetical protein [Piscinibacter terrae]|uniref:DUF2946 domain-containing protein n=1 Tax=Piscinibacter terrae TaxID=2496871 RepID=A0A3N7HKY7_9BURK|nr:hypothetical protein [Albitalea terrae]RQP22760.1 hypothetical protein DZC73_20910 [Albitalea terrae]